MKTLELFIEEATHESIITYLLILINNDWLFPVIFNLFLGLSCSKVNKEVIIIYKKKFNEFYSDFWLTDIEIIDKILEKLEKEKEEKLNQNKNVEKDKNSKKAEKGALKL